MFYFKALAALARAERIHVRAQVLAVPVGLAADREEETDQDHDLEGKLNNTLEAIIKNYYIQ
jgi:hypothetical protein